MRNSQTVKPLCWVGSSKKDLMGLPETVVNVFGYALYLAQIGSKHDQAKPLKGFGSAGVLSLYGSLGRMRVRPARVSEEIQAGCCDT